MNSANKIKYSLEFYSMKREHVTPASRKRNAHLETWQSKKMNSHFFVEMVQNLCSIWRKNIKSYINRKLFFSSALKHMSVSVECVLCDSVFATRTSTHKRWLLVYA